LIKARYIVLDHTLKIKVVTESGLNPNRRNRESIEEAKGSLGSENLIPRATLILQKLG
jgi:hypothetical protein